MTSAKLTGALLVYKDLPSVMGADPGDAAEPALPGSDGQAAPAAVPASPIGAGAGRSHPIVGVALACCGSAALAASALLIFVHTSSQTAPAVPAAPSASASANAPADRLTPSLTVDAPEPTAAPQPAPQDETTLANNAQAAVAIAPDQPTASIGVADVAAPPPEPAPTAPSTPVLPGAPAVAATDGTPQPPDARLTADERAALLARGDAMLGNGDIVSARLLYERAAEGGDARAALQLGATYDPAFLRQAGLRGVRSDPAAAARWYQSARVLGAVEAEMLLSSLASAGAQASDRK